MSQVKAFFSRVWDGISSRITKPQVKRENLLLYFALVFIILGAFIARIYPLFSTPILFKGLDPWAQYRCAEYIYEHGLREFLNWYDQTTWYPFGRNMGKSMYIIIPITSVVLYKIALFMGFSTSLLTVSYFVPAIFGAATILVIYKLGEALHSKRTGVFAAFFLALANGFMSRTIVGFYDNECVGIFLMFLTFYFFVKGQTKDSMINNLLAGISLGLLSLGWGAYRYAYDLLALYALLMILLKKFSRRLFATFSITITLGLFIGALIPRNGLKFVLSTEQLIPLAIIIAMLIIMIYKELQKNIAAKKLKKITQYTIIGIIAAGIIAFITLYAMDKIQPIASKFIRTLLPTFAETIPLIDSVAENLTASWATLFFNVYIMVFLLPLGFYFCIKKPTEKTIFMIIMGLTGVYFGASMVRLALIVTPAAAVVAGYTLDEVLRPFALINQERFTISRRKRRAAKQIGKELITVAYTFIAMTIIFTTIFGGNMLKKQYTLNHDLTPVLQKSDGTLVQTYDYIEAFDYLRTKVAMYHRGGKPPVVLSWWDYGNFIRSLGNCTTLVDNGTINSTQIGIIGAMLIHNESTSYKLMKKFGVDYVLVLSPGIAGSSNNDLYKSQWMMKISEDKASSYLGSYAIKYSDYFIENPSDDEEYGFTDKFWDSVIYKFCAYRLNSDGYDSGQPAIANWRSGLLKDAPDVKVINTNLYQLAFESSHAYIRIYRVL